LSETERRAFMIAVNRLAELASWDDRLLGLELGELKSLDLRRVRGRSRQELRP